MLKHLKLFRKMVTNLQANLQQQQNLAGQTSVNQVVDREKLMIYQWINELATNAETRENALLELSKNVKVKNL